MISGSSTDYHLSSIHPLIDEVLIERETKELEKKIVEEIDSEALHCQHSEYCLGELSRLKTHFIQELNFLKETSKQGPSFKAKVEVLYASMQRDIRYIRCLAELDFAVGQRELKERLSKRSPIKAALERREAIERQEADNATAQAISNLLKWAEENKREKDSLFTRCTVESATSKEVVSCKEFSDVYDTETKRLERMRLEHIKGDKAYGKISDFSVCKQPFMGAKRCSAPLNEVPLAVVEHVLNTVVKGKQIRRSHWEFPGVPPTGDVNAMKEEARESLASGLKKDPRHAHLNGVNCSLLAKSFIDGKAGESDIQHSSDWAKGVLSGKDRRYADLPPHQRDNIVTACIGDVKKVNATAHEHELMAERLADHIASLDSRVADYLDSLDYVAGFNE